MQKIFDIKNFDPKIEKHTISYVLSLLFLGIDDRTTPILKINFTTTTPGKKYEIKIEKTNWNDIKDKAQSFITEAFRHDDPKLAEKVTVENLKSYYDLIKGDKVTITLEVNK